ESGDVLAIADGADHGHLFTTARMRMRSDGLDPVDDGLDFALRRRLLHDDHHLEVPSWLRLEHDTSEVRPRGVSARVTALGPWALSWTARFRQTRPAERLAKSPGAGIGVGVTGERQRDAGS